MATHEDKPVARIVGQYLELHDRWVSALFQGLDTTVLIRGMDELAARMTPDQVELCGEFTGVWPKALQDARDQLRAIGAQRQHEIERGSRFWRRLWKELRWVWEDN